MIVGTLFRYTTTLSAGQHTYYFEASDGSITTRFPEDGTLSVPVAEFPVWIVAGIIAGIAILGSVTYFIVRRQKRVYERPNLQRVASKRLQ